MSKRQTPIEELINDLKTRSLGDVLYNAPVYLMKEQQEIEKAHLEGFKKSAEGYNGEYPFAGYSDEYINEHIEAQEYYNNEFKKD